MTYAVIGSGSSGNAVVINDTIMIDCGLPWKKIEPYSKKLKLVLLTHEHGDHFKPSTVKKLHNIHPSLRFGCCKWMVPLLLNAKVCPSVIDAYNCENGNGYYYNLDGGMELQPIFLPHNVPNCGYKIEFKNEEKLFYATDVSTLEGIIATEFDYYLIEANHSEQEIQERIQKKLDAGEFAYEFQAAKNHLSQEQALDWLSKNAGPNSKYVFLHQHRDT